MVAIIIGLGSMGRRRARLLQALDKSVQIIGIDMQEERRRQAERELGIKTIPSIADACRQYKPEVAFVSTSPLSHATNIKECLENNLHVFTELNLVDTGYDENIELAKAKNKVLFLSSTFLYRKEIQYIKERVKESNCQLSYMYHAGQYLPDWHPWENYKNFFVGDKRTNACREFMAIELPWLTDVFGNIKLCYAESCRNSTLDIDYPDIYHLVLEHENGVKGLLTVDVVSRKAIRRFELSGEDLYLTWDGTPDSVRIYNYKSKEEQAISLYETVEKRNEYSSFVIEDAYASEITNFLNTVKGIEEPRYSFVKDKKILAIIDEIEKEKRG